MSVLCLITTFSVRHQEVESKLTMAVLLIGDDTDMQRKIRKERAVQQDSQIPLLGFPMSH